MYHKYSREIKHKFKNIKMDRSTLQVTSKIKILKIYHANFTEHPILRQILINYTLNTS